MTFDDIPKPALKALFEDIEGRREFTDLVSLIERYNPTLREVAVAMLLRFLSESANVDIDKACEFAEEIRKDREAMFEAGLCSSLDETAKA